MPLQVSSPEPLPVFMDREFERYEVNLPGTILFTGHHLHISCESCLLKDISCGGARLMVSPETEVPPHFFLQIIGTRDEIGSTMVGRSIDSISLKFNMLLSEDFVTAVVKRNSRIGTN